MKNSRPPVNPNKISKKDWELILKEARFNRVDTLLYYYLKKDNDISIPSDIKEKLEDLYLKNSLHNTRIFFELSKILGSAEKEGFPIIALKGSYTACSLYPNTTLRRMYDIDLMVKSEDVMKIHDIMLGLGWECEQEGDSLNEYIEKKEVIKFNKKPLMIELHSKLVQITATDPWLNTLPVKIGASNALAFENDFFIPYLCIHLCDHLLQDRYFELIRICDIILIIRKFGNDVNWDNVIKIAELNESKTKVYHVLNFIKKEIGENIPDIVLKKLKTDEPFITIKRGLYFGKPIPKLIDKLEVIKHIYLVIRLHKLNPGSYPIRRVIFYIIGCVLPSRRYIQERYSPKYSWLFIFYYPYRIIKGILRIISESRK